MTDHTTEEWRAVVGYEGFYEVSDLGRVRSLDRRIRNSVPDSTRVVRGRILRPGKLWTSGHLSVNLNRDGRGKTTPIHSVVLEAFVGPRPNGMEVCHNDGTAANNAAFNLRWDTRLENNRDILRHGTHNNARKTGCPKGHAYDVVRDGKRRCSICDRDRQVARNSRRRKG